MRPVVLDLTYWADVTTPFLLLFQTRHQRERPGFLSDPAQWIESVPGLFCPSPISVSNSRGDKVKPTSLFQCGTFTSMTADSWSLALRKGHPA